MKTWSPICGIYRLFMPTVSHKYDSRATPGEIQNQRHLGVSNRKLAAILDLPILHRIAVSENSIAGFDAINNASMNCLDRKSRRLMGALVSCPHLGFRNNAEK